MINLLLLNNFDIAPASSKGKGSDELSYIYGSVTRYGPQCSPPAQAVNTVSLTLFLFASSPIFTQIQLMYIYHISFTSVSSSLLSSRYEITSSSSFTSPVPLPPSFALSLPSFLHLSYLAGSASKSI